MEPATRSTETRELVRPSKVAAFEIATSHQLRHLARTNLTGYTYRVRRISA